MADQGLRAQTEEGKASSNLYALNPISRRYVLKTSDVYLRLLKSGVVSDPETMEALDLRKREASRARQRGAAAAARAAAATERQVKPKAKQLAAPSEAPEPEPEPEPVAPKPVVVSKKPDRADIRRRVIQVALDHRDELDGCQDDEELEERLRRLLLAPKPRPTSADRVKRASATHSRPHAWDSDNEETDY